MLAQVLEVAKRALPIIIAGIVLMLIFEARAKKSCNCNGTATTDTTVDPGNVTITK